MADKEPRWSKTFNSEHLKLTIEANAALTVQEAQRQYLELMREASAALNNYAE